MLLLLAFALPLYSIATGISSTTSGVDVSSPTSQFDCPENKNWSPDDRRGALKVHNELRKRLREGTYVAGNGKTVPFFKKPKAKPGTMPDVTYNCTMEYSVQKFADTCPKGHRGEFMENHWSVGPVPEKPANFSGLAERASQTWESEFQHNRWECNLMRQEEWYKGGIQMKLGHATMMAWAKMTRIGCGVSYCNKGIFVACQYFPYGNAFGEYIYETDGEQPPCESSASSIQLPLLCLLAVALLRSFL